MTPSGRSRTTAAPAPTVTSAPTRTRWITLLPMPTHVASPTVTSPATRAPGHTCTPSPSTASWSTEHPVLKMHAAPARTHAFTATCAKTTVPSPSDALGDTHAVGCTTTGRTNPLRRRSFCTRSRVRACPMPTTASG